VYEKRKLNDVGFTSKCGGVVVFLGILLLLPPAVLSAAAALPRQAIGSRALASGVELKVVSLHTPSSRFAGDVETGKELFIGKRPLLNGGPACASCHGVAILPFPHGGTMAPDLTHEYSKLGPAGMHYALRTLYFPAMNALFLKHQLSDQEERDLSAFFEDADSAKQINSHTGVFGGAAVAGLLVLVGITWVSGRGRVDSVRHKLLRRAGLYRENR
jgi:cytochrome c553